MPTKSNKVFVLQRFIFAGLRKLSRFYPLKNEALKKARVAPATFQCAACKKEFDRSSVNVDHIDPVIDPKTGFRCWCEYISRLFCGVEGLQVLCKECHDKKTFAEAKIRRLRSATNKGSQSTNKQCKCGLG